jgi:subtilisin family serine protease
VKVNIRRVGVVTPDGRVTDFTNLGVAAAVVDTGIDRRHPDLNVAGGKNFCATDPTNDPYVDGFGHGTHVAGIIGARNNGKGIIGAAPGGRAGVGAPSGRPAAGIWGQRPCRRRARAAEQPRPGAHPACILLSATPFPPPAPLPRSHPHTPPGIPIYSLKVLAADGTGTTSDLLKAYEWLYYNARALGIRVVNLSLTGGGGESDPQCEWAAALSRQGITVVAAAGNNKASLMTEAPGACAKTLVVSPRRGPAPCGLSTQMARRPLAPTPAPSTRPPPPPPRPRGPLPLPTRPPPPLPPLLHAR